MRIKRFANYVMDAIRDPERDFSERVFLIFSIISECAVLIALAGDVLMGENASEIVMLVLLLVFVPLITFISLYKEKIKLAIGFLVASLVLAVIPALFFFGGGLEGGGFLWIIFAFMYVGLVINGKWRKRLIIFIFLMVLGCFLLAYYYPQLVHWHSRPMQYVDTFISVILVGVMCFVMTWSQNQLFIAENARARRAAQRAEELSQEQNRFFSRMSHEIRTPINSILGLNELILRDEGISDEVARDASGIQGAGRLLLALINDILDFSKMEAGSMDIVPVDYHVGDMLSEVVGMLWLKAREKGLGFHVSIDPGVPSVLYGDEVRIKQIIINLLNNAVKYTAEGSVDLYIECVDTNEKETVLSIRVSDTGMGIKKESIPHLFDAFKRVDEEKNRYIEGTGLGLSIVKQLVELMDGTVKVSSVYGEGSTFTVTVRQGISDGTEVGELNIHSQQAGKRSQYESSFKAPDARVLIVDDNEMNLEVERKLLLATELGVDTVISGREALERTLQVRYDVILMDHLMPEMDGVECLKYIRNQSGGLNRTTPVVVLTANAGSKNREIYNRSGFDGYMVKPVSGEALEDILMKHIAKDKLILNNKLLGMHEDINATAGYARKEPVLITTTSMSDIPDTLVRKLRLPIIPFLIRTEEGVFKDGVQMEADELIRYINGGRSAVSMVPTVEAYTDYFAQVLKEAHNLIHISITTSMSEDFKMASEAARAFDNVTVINSGCLSSATGILVLIAYKLAQQNLPVNEIINEIESIKHCLRCSFVIDRTEYMARRKLLSPRVSRIAEVLSLHPIMRLKDDQYGIGGICVGSTKEAYRKYIRKVFPVYIIPDPEVVFITYADVPLDTLLWIKEEISKHAYFEHVIFQQASAAISSNCGPGTFGILYIVKSNKAYNIGSLMGGEEDGEREDSFLAEDDLTAQPEEDASAVQPEDISTIQSKENASVVRREEDISTVQSVDRSTVQPEAEQRWYQGLDGIDADMAIKNSGSEDAFRTVLKIFYDSIGQKSEELERYFASEDWKNYTIKIHALKSSSKLVGAMELSKKAESLEMAGKEENAEYIILNHSAAMRDYVRFKETLSGLFEEDTAVEEVSDRPVADASIMESVYEGLREAADEMDCDVLERILRELEEYSIPDTDREKYNKIRQMVEQYDYDGILEILDS